MGQGHTVMILDRIKEYLEQLFHISKNERRNEIKKKKKSYYKIEWNVPEDEE